MHIGGDFVHIEVAFQYEEGLLEVQQHILVVGMPWEVDRHQGVELQASSLVVLVLGVLHSSVGVQVAEQLELMGVDLGVDQGMAVGRGRPTHEARWAAAQPRMQKEKVKQLVSQKLSKKQRKPSTEFDLPYP